MDSNYLPAIAALVGSAIGGFTSLATTWLNQYHDTKSRRMIQDRVERETLFAQFIDEATALFADAFTHDSTDLTKLGKLYGIINRMRLLTAEDIVRHADIVADKIIDAYLAPNITFSEIHTLQKKGALDPLRDFSNACRAELRRFGGQ